MEKRKKVYYLLSSAELDYLDENSTENYNSGLLKDLTNAKKYLQSNDLSKALDTIKIAKKSIKNKNLEKKLSLNLTADIWTDLYKAQGILLKLKRNS